MKKLTLISLAAATAMFMACGDDSSSGTSGESGNNSKSVKDLMEAVETLDCNADHECETVFLEESGTYAECHANAWSELFTGKSIVCPENDFTSSSSEADEEDLSSDSDDEDVSSSSEHNSVIGGESSSSEQGQSIEGSSDSGDGESSASTQQSSGLEGRKLFSCLIIMEIGGISTQTCDEVADEDSAPLKTQCVSYEGFMEAIQGKGCPDEYTKKCELGPSSGMQFGSNHYFYEEANASQSCDELIQAK